MLAFAEVIWYKGTGVIAFPEKREATVEMSVRFGPASPEISSDETESCVGVFAGALLLISNVSARVLLEELELLRVRLGPSF